MWTLTRIGGLLMTIALLFAAPALAHEGHGASDGRLLAHYLVEPMHLPLTALGVVALIGLIALVWRGMHQRVRASR